MRSASPSVRGALTNNRMVGSPGSRTPVRLRRGSGCQDETVVVGRSADSKGFVPRLHRCPGTECPVVVPRSKPPFAAWKYPRRGRASARTPHSNRERYTAGALRRPRRSARRLRSAVRRRRAWTPHAPHVERSDPDPSAPPMQNDDARRKPPDSSRNARRRCARTAREIDHARSRLEDRRDRGSPRRRMSPSARAVAPAISATPPNDNPAGVVTERPRVCS